MTSTDTELRRLARALVDEAPPPPSLDDAPLPVVETNRRSRRPVVLAAAVAVVVAAGIAVLGTRGDPPSSSVAAGDRAVDVASDPDPGPGSDGAPASGLVEVAPFVGELPPPPAGVSADELFAEEVSLGRVQRVVPIRSSDAAATVVPSEVVRDRWVTSDLPTTVQLARVEFVYDYPDELGWETEVHSFLVWVVRVGDAPWVHELDDLVAGGLPPEEATSYYHATTGEQLGGDDLPPMRPPPDPFPTD